MTSTVGMAKCRHCGDEITLTLAGWIHDSTDARFCVEWNDDTQSWEQVGDGFGASPKLTNKEQAVLAVLAASNAVRYCWPSNLSLRTGQTIRGTHRTCASLVRKGLVARHVTDHHNIYYSIVS